MSEKLNKLRMKLTEKQVEFVDLLKSGQDRADAYVNATFKAKSRKIAQQCACKLLTTNKKVMAYFDALRAEDDRKTSISRTMQLNRLNFLYELAVKQKNVTAGKAVIAEQNEMLGYHRETAPNLEREAAQKAMEAKEAEKLAELAHQRTEDESTEPKPASHIRLLRAAQEAS